MTKLPVLVVLIAAFLSAVRPAHAGDRPSFAFPLACTPGKTCWIVNYVDEAPGPAAKDYTCGSRTYDGHDGTDIGLPDRVAMETGVNVLAAAPGTILRIRDNMEDHEPDDKEIAELLKANRGCGNGVIVDHGGGWQTLYCHMKQDSISVKPHQTVQAGDVLGKAGQSGAAEFPHLHFGVLYNGRTIDPFTGAPAGTRCNNSSASSLWAPNAAPAYDPVIIYAAGFHAGAPDFEAIKIDTTSPRMLDASSKIMTFWAAFYGLSKGDRIRLSITAPDGRLFATREIVADRDRARQFFYIGRKTANGLAAGSYKGSANLSRDIPGGNKPLTRSMERDVLVR